MIEILQEYVGPTEETRNRRRNPINRATHGEISGWYDISMRKDDRTLAGYRNGVSLMWRFAKEEMERAGALPMGSYDKENIHHGVIWGRKTEVPFTETSVKRIMYKCIKSNKLTLACLGVVRKSFSFAYSATTTFGTAPAPNGSQGAAGKVLQLRLYSRGVADHRPPQTARLPPTLNPPDLHPTCGGP